VKTRSGGLDPGRVRFPEGPHPLPAPSIFRLLQYGEYPFDGRKVQQPLPVRYLLEDSLTVIFWITAASSILASDDTSGACPLLCTFVCTVRMYARVSRAWKLIA
jgi:hypothetical protein